MEEIRGNDEIETGAYIRYVRISREEVDKVVRHIIWKSYNGEFDPGSG